MSRKKLREQSGLDCSDLLSGKWKYAIEIDTNCVAPTVHRNDERFGAEVRLHVCERGPRIFDTVTWVLADSDEELRDAGNVLWEDFLRDCDGAPPESEVDAWLKEFPHIVYPEREAARLREKIRDSNWRLNRALSQVAGITVEANRFRDTIAKLGEELEALRLGR